MFSCNKLRLALRWDYFTFDCLRFKILQIKLNLFFLIFRLGAPVTKPPPEVTEKPEVSKKLRQLDGYVGFANMPNQVYRFRSTSPLNPRARNEHGCLNTEKLFNIERK